MTHKGTSRTARRRTTTSTASATTARSANAWLHAEAGALTMDNGSVLTIAGGSSKAAGPPRFVGITSQAGSPKLTRLARCLETTTWRSLVEGTGGSGAPIRESRSPGGRTISRSDGAVSRATHPNGATTDA